MFIFRMLVNFKNSMFYKDNFLLLLKITWILYQENEIVAVSVLKLRVLTCRLF